MAASKTGGSLETTLKDYVRVYEEQLIIEEAAKIYAKLASDDGIHLNDLYGELDFPNETVALLFHKYDEDDSGTIDAKELLGLIRQHNFMRGSCDGCYKPVGGNDGSFLCVSCDFCFCAECYPERGRFHHEHSEYEPSYEVEIREAAEPRGLPLGVGDLVSNEVNKLFKDVKGNRNADFVTTDEFRNYCHKHKWDDATIDFVMRCDFDGDGRISRREALYLLTGLAMVRSCDECDELSFISDERLLSCVECTADYDICLDCWKAGKRSHSHHERFQLVKTFEPRTVGLYYQHSHDDMWTVAVGNAKLWAKFEPFVSDKVVKTARLGAPPRPSKTQNRVVQPRPPKTQTPAAQPQPPKAKKPVVPPAVKQFGVDFANALQQNAEKAARKQVKKALRGKNTDWVAISNNVTLVAGEVLSWFG